MSVTLVAKSSVASITQCYTKPKAEIYGATVADSDVLRAMTEHHHGGAEEGDGPGQQADGAGRGSRQDTARYVSACARLDRADAARPRCPASGVVRSAVVQVTPNSLRLTYCGVIHVTRRVAAHVPAGALS